MTTPPIAELLKYADLQMAAEGFLFNDDGTPVPDLKQALVDGNKHASKFTAIQADNFLAHWEVVSQKPNTTTGFSGTLFRNKDTNELVMSFRSTEFIDDAARDTLATNSMELSNTGFAWGQIADMQAWFKSLRDDPNKLGANSFSLTGYSLGGHLATAFNLLNPNAATQTVTFNGAGVGVFIPGAGDLTSALAEFNNIRGTPSRVLDYLGSDLLKTQYQNIRTHLADKSWTVDDATNYLKNAYPTSQQESRPAMVAMVLAALAQMKELAGEAARVTTLHAGGSGQDATTHPDPVLVQDIAGADLDYRMAVELMALRTQPPAALDQLTQAYGEKTILPIPSGNTALANQYDVVAGANPSAVGNSFAHYGKDMRVAIEEQPLYRGGVGLAAVEESLRQGGVRLLVDDYAVKDFGDTHSLVLLVDSLNVQNALLQLLPTAQREAATGMVQGLWDSSKGKLQEDKGGVLQAASNLRAANGEFALGGGQGKAEGDVLENVLNALADLLVGPGQFTPLKGSPDGATWFEMAVDGPDGYTGRNQFYELLKSIQSSTLYSKVRDGDVTLQLSVAGPGLAQDARIDFGAYAALYSLSPFVVTATQGGAEMEAAVGGAWKDNYVRWSEDRNHTANPDPAYAFTISDNWLTDRAALLTRKLYYNADARNATYDSTDPKAVGNDAATLYDSEGIVWRDLQSGLTIRRGSTTGLTRDITFGSDRAEVLLGSNSALGDHLYGDGGADYLEGRGGSDYVEGGAGVDVYAYADGDGNDTIRDADGKGVVRVTQGDTSLLVAGYFSKNSAAGANVWKSLDNKLVLTKTAILDADGNPTGREDLGIGFRNPDGSVHAGGVTVKDFKNGDLNIHLADAGAPADPSFVRNIVGGVLQTGSPADDLGNAAIVPDTVDANVANALNGSALEDRIRSGGGDDVIRADKVGTSGFAATVGDWLQAGDGRDNITAGSGNDVIETGTGGGDQTLWNSSGGGDVVNAGAGNDVVYGDGKIALADAIALGDGPDGSMQSSGLAGRGDFLSGMAGDDTLVGTTASDRLDGGLGADVLIGGAGDDWLSGDAGFTAQSAQWGVNTYYADWDYDAMGISADVRGVVRNNFFSIEVVPVVIGMAGPGGADQIYAGAGNDTVFAGGGDDFIDAGSGSDLVYGGAGADIVNAGDGDDFVMGDLGDGDSDGQAGDVIDGGAGDDYLFGLGGDDILFGGVGADWLEGGSGNDILIGGPGVDHLRGGKGRDTYIFAKGTDAQQDYVYDADDSGRDLNGDPLAAGTYDRANKSVIVVQGVQKSNVKLRLGSLMLDLGDGNQIHFEGFDPQNTNATPMFERVEFDDGSVMTYADALAQGFDLDGTAGDDSINGTEVTDRINGMGGDDSLQGGGGDDTYLFDLGNGHDTINDSQGANTLRFGIGILPQDIDFCRIGSDLVLSVTGTDDQVTVKNWGNNTAARLAHVEFADGTVWNTAYVNTTAFTQPVTGTAAYDHLAAWSGEGVATLAGGAGPDHYTVTHKNDLVIENPNEGMDAVTSSVDYTLGANVEYLTLVGSAVAATGNALDNVLDGNALGNVLSGGLGNDTLYGEAGDDFLNGGVGDDHMEGDGGADTYSLKLGSGQDTVFALDYGLDSIVFGAGISASSLSASRSLDGTLLRYGTSGDRVLITGGSLRDMRFADGSHLTMEQVFAAGGGYQVQGGAGSDFLDDTSLWANTIQGGAGNDKILGGGGDTTYIVNLGGGDDSIVDLGGFDTLSFGKGIGVADVSFGNIQYDGVPTFHVFYNDGSVSIMNGGQGSIEQFRFHDGSVYSFAQLAQMQGFVAPPESTFGRTIQLDFGHPNMAPELVGGTAGNDVIRASNEMDAILVGGKGNDSIVIFDNDGLGKHKDIVFNLGDGLDTLSATSHGTVSLVFGSGITRGSLGFFSAGVGRTYMTYGDQGDALFFYDGAVNDFGFADGSRYSYYEMTRTLPGPVGGGIMGGGQGGGSAYRFDLGSGPVQILGSDVTVGGRVSFAPSAISTVQFGPGINASMLRLGRGSLVIRVGTEGDALHLADFDPDDALAPSQIQNFKFADGSSLGYAELLARGFDLEGTGLADAVTGTNVTDRIDALAGDDTLRGGAGDDMLNGGMGNDVYQFKLGDGVDRIFDYDTQRNVDVVQFDVSVLAGDVAVRRNREDLELSIAGSADRVILSNWYGSDAYKVEEIRFADGTTWGVQHLRTLAPLQAIVGTDGDDVLQSLGGVDNDVRGLGGNDLLDGSSSDDVLDGGAGDDTFTGGAGTDILIGGGGNDTYAYFVGDGFDTILDTESASGGNDTLLLGGGIAAADVTVIRGASQFVLALNETDTVTIEWDPAHGLGMEHIVFDDGTVWAGSELWALGNSAPTATGGVADQHAVEASLWSLSLTPDLFVDSDAGDVLGYTATNSDGSTLPGWLLFEAPALRFSGTPQAGATGSYDVTLTATDPYGATAQVNFALTVVAPNHAPQVDGVINTLWAVETRGVYMKVPESLFYDPDADDVLRLSASLVDGSALPSWLVFDAATRTLQGTPPSGAAGVLSIAVTAADNAGASAVAGFNLDIAHLVEGTNQRDTLNGSSGRDILYGLDGNDKLYGREGDDVLYGEYEGYEAAGTEPIDTLVIYARGTVCEGVWPVMEVWLSGNRLQSFNVGSATIAAYHVTVPLGTTTDQVDVVFANDAYRPDIGQDRNLYVDRIDVNGHAVSAKDLGAVVDWGVGGGAMDGVNTGVSNGVLSSNGAIHIRLGQDSDLLDGGAGADAMYGGAGNDVYMVDNDGDHVQEDEDSGHDIVRASVSYGLGDNLEDLELIGTQAVEAYGNSGRNTLRGNAQDNYLDGDAGADVMVGGLGNDHYVVDDVADAVIEAADAGTDIVESYVSFTLAANVENLLLAGDGGINGTGNALANTLTGNMAANSLYGGAGTDALFGEAGSDRLYGGEGNDNLLGDAADETGGAQRVESLVVYARGTACEGGWPTMEVWLAGQRVQSFSVTSVEFAAYIVTVPLGVDARSVDLLFGNDAYRPDLGQDRNLYVDRIELNGRTLAAKDVGAVLDIGAGATAFDGVNTTVSSGTLTSNGTIRISLENTSDLLDGGAGADDMTGGLGNDVYVVDNMQDTLHESANSGHDTVRASVSYTLSDNLEDLELGGSQALNATGNALRNTLRGNAGANRLDGGAGADWMVGGVGNDTYVVDDAADAVVEVADGGIDSVESSVSFTLGNDVENLMLTGASSTNGTGNALDNLLTGNAAANTLNGAAGNDTLNAGAGSDKLYGGDGNDTLIGDAAGETGVAQRINTLVVYARGTACEGVSPTMEVWLAGQLVQSFVVASADFAAYTVTVPQGVDARSVDVLFGNDAYRPDLGQDRNLYVDRIEVNGRSFAAKDVGTVLDYGAGTAAFDGVNTAVSTGTLASNGAIRISLEDNNDLLDGGTGADDMSGGSGNDLYAVDNAQDIVHEAVNAGHDTVRSTASYTLGENIEDLELGGSQTLNATGNALRNTLRGNAAANRLDGGGAADVMVGGAGNDTYIVDNIADVASEAADAGIDSVESSVSFTLGSYVENLTLTGTSGINGTGNTLDNLLAGNSANNTLSGGAGNDVLNGGAGNDILNGGAGSDVYGMNRGGGSDVINENDATAGNMDRLQFGMGITADQLWFSRTGNNLDIAVIGTADKASLSNWYSGNQYHVEQFQTSDGKTLIDSQVQNLVSAMASFAPPAMGQTNLSAAYASQLNGVIAAGWQ